LKKLIILLCLAALTAFPAFADTTDKTISFNEVWKLVKDHSPELKAADYDLKAAKIGESRAANHWYPHLTLNAKAFETDDPATSFMSVLEERQIGPADFASQALNQPPDSFYEQGSLSLDFPLYEGGAKTSMADSATQSRKAQEMQQKAVLTAQYVQLAGSYAGLLVLADEQMDIQQLDENVGGILKRYSIGSKSNPVGYSGLLGLKNLQNRLEGLQAQARAQVNTLKNQIQIQAESLEGDWSPEPAQATDFLDHVFSVGDSSQEPAFVLAAQAGADAVEKMRGAQSALLLPQVGLFGEGDLNNGDRNLASSYTVGAYLRWDLLDISNWGAGEQAGDTAQAAQARAEELKRQAQSSLVQARESLSALKTNLSLMEDSQTMLEEQTETAKGLFKNGSINALQLVEVLARRADLISTKAQAQMDLVQARVTLVMNSGFQETDNDNQ
jgi:outer membrane protein TolC